MKRTVPAALAIGAIGITAASAEATITHHSCGDLGSAVGNIRSTNTSRATARKVARADVQGKKYRRYKCTSIRTPDLLDLLAHADRLDGPRA